MPPSDTREDQRNARIFSALFWVGVGLAPLAALVLLVGSGTGSLRVCLGLVILSVILIGVSITLRRDSDGIRSEIEDTVFEEIDALRADVRDDIAHAAQATHRAFGEKMQYLLDQIESAKADLAATKVQVDALRHGIASPPQPQRHAASAEVHQPPAAPRPGMPPGVVRHTETVQVTTRHTVMDPHDEIPRGTTYGRPAPVSAPRGESRGEPRGEESWTDQRLREQFERRREEPQAERWQPRESSYEDRWSVPSLLDDEERRPGVRAGDRWASVRSDDRGREVRMGERRAAMHADPAGGTELRIEDRWAAVRREAGLPAQSWQQQPQQDDYRDYEPERSERHDRRAITGADREERWSDYQTDYERDRERERERDRDYDRRYR